MGMDVYGMNPSSPCGNHFGITVWGWRPLATYVCEVAPEIASKCKYWFSNDCDGLNGEDSLLLADLLQKEIDSGRARDYARVRQLAIELAPYELCYDCNATGRAGDHPPRDSIVCDRCNGEGCVPPSVEIFVQILREFARFLNACGGFRFYSERDKRERAIARSRANQREIFDAVSRLIDACAKFRGDAVWDE